MSANEPLGHNNQNNDPNDPNSQNTHNGNQQEECNDPGDQEDKSMEFIETCQPRRRTNPFEEDNIIIQLQPTDIFQFNHGGPNSGTRDKVRVIP